MAGKPYAEYEKELDTIAYSHRVQRDSLYVKQLAMQMREVANVAKDKRWALEADFLEKRYDYFLLFNCGNLTSSQKDSLSDAHIQDLQLIIQKAKKIKAVDIELRTLFHSWIIFCHYIKDYEMSFRYSLDLDEALSEVTQDAFPAKFYYYTEMGKQYYYFHEYEIAKLYFERGFEHSDEYGNESSWNSLGLIYRIHYHDLEKSDSCFLKIIRTDSIYQGDYEYELWAAIAKGNLGVNYYLRGNYNNAIPLLKYGMEKSIEDNEYNYAYAIGKAHILAEIFLAMHDFAQAKLYIEKMHTFLNIISGDETALASRMHYYDFMSRYFRTLGKDTNAFLYTDSTAMARAEFENAFNFRKLHRAMQYVQQEKLDAEKLRNKIYYHYLILISTFAILLFLLLTFLYHLYRQKQAAYRALVIKTQQWAQVSYTQLKQEYNSDEEEIENSELQNDYINDLPTETDQQLFNRFNLLMTEQKIYQNANLTLPQLAQKMNVNRTYLSQAINRCTGISFSTYINEFRIKEAVRLMSNPKLKNICIEGIALDSGFNDRSTFYRVFKKTTGFSPTTFRNNLAV